MAEEQENKGVRYMQSEQIKEKVMKVIDLCFEINGGLETKRDREITGSLPTAFFDYSGHVANLYVKVFPAGWSSYGTSIRTKVNLSNTRAEADLDTLIKTLTKIKEDAKARQLEAPKKQINIGGV